MIIDIDNIDLPPELIIKEEPKESISEILSNENTTIENILNYSSLLEELNSKNEELLNYFNKEKIKILIDYIIKEPNDDNFDKGHKFPFICAEIFKLEKEQILKYFFINDNNDNNIDLLNHLLSFISNKSVDIKKLNYILCGYFSSTVEALLNYNPNSFLEYIYLKRKDFLIIMAHCCKKSIFDLLSKILFFENYYINNDKIKLSEKNKTDFNKIRNDILIDIFKNIKIDMDNEELNSIYYFITKFFENDSINILKEAFKKLIENRYAMKNLIYNTLYNTDLINYLDKDIAKMENKRKNFVIIIDIINFILKNINILKFELPLTNSNTDKKVNIKHTKVSQEIFNILERLIKVNFNKKDNKGKKILTSFNKYLLLPLGEYIIKIVELITNLIPYFSKCSKLFDQVLIKTNFFKFGFDYIFEYEWNNLYQEEFLHLIKNILLYSSEHEFLIEHLFKDIKILELIKNNLIISENNKFKYNNDISTDISRGYKAFLINLSYKINIFIGDPPIGNNLNRSFEFKCNKNAINEKQNYFNIGNNINIHVNSDNIDEDIKENENFISNELNNNKEKFSNKDWDDFYKNEILPLIKQYNDKYWPNKKEENIFDFLFEENNDSNDNGNDKIIEIINNDKNNLLYDIKEEAILAKNEEDAYIGADKLSKELIANDKAAKDLSLQVQKMNKGVESLSKNWENWSDMLKNSSKGSKEYYDALDDTKEALSDLLDISEDFI